MHAADRHYSRRAHARTQVHLSDYLDDVLSTRKRSRLERHIRACQECRRTVASVPNTLRMLRSLKVETPPSLVDGVLDRLDDLQPSTEAAPSDIRGNAIPPSHRAVSTTPGGARGSGLPERARDVLAYCLTPAYLWRSIPIALVIGIALTVIDQLPDFLAGRADAGAYVMCACNFIIPFVLVSAGLVIARAAPRTRRR